MLNATKSHTAKLATTCITALAILTINGCTIGGTGSSGGNDGNSNTLPHHIDSPTSSPSPDPAPDPIGASLSTSAVHYVALGDSRAAAPMRTVTALNACGQSGLGYPRILQRTLAPDTFTDVTCTGATTNNIINTPQSFSGGYVNPVQLNAVHEDTTLITVSTGGNDTRWGRFAKACKITAPGQDARCRLSGQVRDEMASGLSLMHERVDDLLSELRAKAPNATVVIVGHGGPIDNRGCFPNVPLSDLDAVFITRFLDDMNATLQQVADMHGAVYVDVAGPATGKDGCAPGGVDWFDGVTGQSGAEPYHPSPLGSKQIAKLIAEAIDKN